MLANAIDEMLLHGFHRLPSVISWRMHDRVLRRIRNHGIRLPPRVVRCRDGFRLLVDPADWIGSHVALKREFEPGLTRIVQRFLNRGDHFVDVGANIGYFSLLAAGVTGSTGWVSAFEASPITRQALARNIALNGLQERIVVEGAAAWDAVAELIFHQGPVDNSGLSSLAAMPRTIASFNVIAAPLDDLVPFRQKSVHFVKLDVEGAEYNVLAGMRKIIHACRPIIALELSPRLLQGFGHNSEALLRLVTRDFGYEVHWYDSRGQLSPADTDALAGEHDAQENLLLLPV